MNKMQKPLSIGLLLLLLAVLAIMVRFPSAVSAVAQATATSTPVIVQATATPAPAETAGAAAPVAAAPAAEPGSITVSGNAQVLVAPDEVILTLGIETSDLNMAVAKRKNDEIIQRVLNIATKYGVESKHVQTDYINIEPRYSSSPTQSNFIGYFVRKTVEIRLSDISTFESLYSEMLEAGVNYVHGVEFRTTELRKYRDQARQMAIQAAQEKAAALASGVEQTTGRVKMIREDSNNWSGSYNSWWQGSNYALQNVTQNAGGGQFVEEGTLAPGQISVTASVTVEFELLPK